MPLHTLDIFARGLGVWAEFPASERARAARPYVAPARRSLSDLPPVPLRRPTALFRALHDLRLDRAAIYVGDMYLVLNATAPVSALTRHFDNLIRAADRQRA